jgi:D-glycero-D-manno-heptose 1,7-bisphosphate phosphatase
MLLFSHTKPQEFPQATLFLDRDGVINEDHGYVHSKENFHFRPGIFELVLAARAKGYLCVVVTNQAGIGRGLYTTKQFKTLSTWMCEQFQNRGAFIDAIYYSPFHPTKARGRYLLKESTRKPGAGMFLEAADELNIDLSKSIMVGDKVSDVKASLKANISSNYLLSSSYINLQQSLNDKVEIVSELHEIVTGLQW